MGRTVAKSGITPNMISVIGLLGSGAAGWLTGADHLFTAGLVFLFFALLDLVDGAVARAAGLASPFGAVFDAVLDRGGEILLLAGCAWYFEARDEPWNVAATFAALLGSVSVSYMRARAEASAGFIMREGLFRRQERVAVISLGLLTGYLAVAIWIIAVLSHLTAIQRFFGLARALDD
jgi:CDP-diacylglycerol--glycerol-3-phosphate 3-phosphatidyltransferase